jgi:hypothetical protein
MRPIIAFTGLARAGKSTAALRLVEAHGFHRVRFAGPLKDMMRALGLTEAEIEGAFKETPCALLCGKTPRLAMQTIGTEWGRDIIGADVWVNAWRRAVDRLAEGCPVVIDDCRFPNEAEAIMAAGGVIVRVESPRAGTVDAGHSSEAHRLPATLTIDNAGTLDDFFAAVDALARDTSWAFSSVSSRQPAA